LRSRSGRPSLGLTPSHPSLEKRRGAPIHLKLRARARRKIV
jgi:hypothetical protein